MIFILLWLNNVIGLEHVLTRQAFEMADIIVIVCAKNSHRNLIEIDLYEAIKLQNIYIIRVA